MTYFATAPHLDRVLLTYSLIVGVVAEVAYLWSAWPDLSLWTIAAAMGLASIMAVEVYVVCLIGFRLLCVWLDDMLHYYEEENR